MEYFDVCDEHGMPTGEIVDRKTAHALGIRHRTAHIWVIRFQEDHLQLLLQRRSRNKDSHPGCLDTSSAGHIQAGDEPLASACRELAEELGIHAEPEQLLFIGQISAQFSQPFHGEMFRDSEIANVYVYSQPVKTDELLLQAEEVEAVCWKDFAWVEQACRVRDPEVCVPLESLLLLKKQYSAVFSK